MYPEIYTITCATWNQYGASTDDWSNSLPGLPDMYYLQNVADDCDPNLSTK